MHTTSFLINIRVLVVFFLISLLSCGERSAEEAGARLDALFPASAQEFFHAEVRADAAVGVMDEGFALRGPRVRQARPSAPLLPPIEALLPARGEDAVMLWLPGFAVRVTEEGVGGEGHVRGGAVVYARDGGASLWMQGGSGCEEWLLFEHGTGDGVEPVAVWHVEGAALAQDGDQIVLKDARGEARIEVQAPLAFTARGASLPVWIEAHGQDIALFAAPTEEPVLIDPEWRPTSPTKDERSGYDAVRLKDGRVLVMSKASTADIYDESTDRWTETGPQMGAHLHGTSTLLADGRVLVAGGLHDPTFAEIYDPATNAWRATGSMSAGRGFHTATLLPDGRVLVAGGLLSAGAELPSAEIYDPQAAAWTRAGAMTTSRQRHAAVLLPNGKVLLAGGEGAAAGTTAELYDPKAGQFAATGKMVTMHFNEPAAVLLPSGKALLVGANVVNGDAGLYDPATNTWSLAGTLPKPRLHMTATLMPSGAVLVAGGFFEGTYLAQADLYDPATNTWLTVQPLQVPRAEHTATLLPSGAVLMAGGFEGANFLLSAELFRAAGSFCCDRSCDIGCQSRP